MRKITLALAAAAAALAAAAPASAADYTVTSGKLDWTIANAFTGFGDPSRTFLGYITFNQVGNPGSSNGTVTPTAPATLTGPTGAAAASVTPDSARGLDQPYTLGYPATNGTYSDAGVGAVELAGKFTFTSHGLPITFVDPLITLNGLTGTIKASGASADQTGKPFTYDRSATQFTLDLSNASVLTRADGSRKIVGIVPLSTNESALAGFGPNSNRYGTMSLTLALNPTQVSAAPRDGATGPAGKDGVNGKDGRDATLSVIRLTKAPFATKAEVHVRLIDRATGKSVAVGTVQQRTLRLGVLAGTKLKGTYTLKRTAKKASGKLQTTVKI